MSKIIDLSPLISPSSVVWPGDPPVRLKRLASLADGDSFTLTEIAMSAHTGTHIDAPAHYMPEGAGIDALPLAPMVGPALVVDTGMAEVIDAPLLERLPIPAQLPRLLFRTSNSARQLITSSQFHTDFVAITADGADWLIQRGVQLVGIDYYSIAPYDDLVPTHQRLLQAGVIIVEGLDLRPVQPGPYQFICLPLKLSGTDGAPARAILIAP